MIERVSSKVASFTESVIREMTRLSDAHGAINLSQGLPDFPCPPELKRAVKDAVDADLNQYPTTYGERALREAIAAKTGRTYPGWRVDPATELCVTCGATEAMVATMLALIEPGDEVILFEPHYENYGPDTVLAGATPVYVPLRRPDWTIDEAELTAAFSHRTRAIVVNTPHNPTGKVFSRAELDLIARLCQRWDTLCVTDEIYEHIHYLDEPGHVPPATVPGLEDRTVTINSLSKTYAVTGWRVGWTIAPAWATAAIRTVHDFLTVGAPTPLQAAGVTALGLPAGYYAELAGHYRRLRDTLCGPLAEIGFELHEPDGAYYVLCGTGRFDPDADDVAFVRRLVTEIGVAAVPGSSFYADPAQGRDLIRFAFPKRPDTLAAAIDRLGKLGG